MKSLDLNKYGVQEMNSGEMSKTEGGLFWILAALVVLAAIDFLQDGHLDGNISI